MEASGKKKTCKLAIQSKWVGGVAYAYPVTAEPGLFFSHIQLEKHGGDSDGYDVTTEWVMGEGNQGLLAGLIIVLDKGKQRE